VRAELNLIPHGSHVKTPDAAKLLSKKIITYSVRLAL